MPVFTGGSADDNIDQRFSAGNDTLDGGLGADTMRGGDGNDVYIVDNVGDIVEEFFADPFAGDDTVVASVSFSLDVVLTSPVRGIENLVLTGSAGLTGIGNALNNTITGNSGGNLLSGLDGNDSLNGGTGGNDTLRGGEGNDTLNGGGGSDSTDGGNGDDYIVAVIGADVAIGGAGTDTLDTTPYSGNYAVNLETGTTNFIGESFTGFENLITGDGNDTLTGTTGANLLNGSGGNDSVNGGTGFVADTLIGGEGNDTLNGGSGPDSADGGNGDDYIFASNGVDTAIGGAGIDTLDTTSFAFDYEVNLQAGATNFVGESFTEFENLISGNGNDTLIGTADNNSLAGGGGNDTLDGGFGYDTLNGGDGIDAADYRFYSGSLVANLGTGVASFPAFPGPTESLISIENILAGAGDDALTGNGLDNLIDGGAGADALLGGAGADTLVGGAGNDTLTGTGTLRGEGDDDRFFANGATRVEGGDGDDLVFGAAASGGSFDGGAGNDVLDLSGLFFSEATINLDQASFSLGGATYAGFEGLIATDATETLAGTSAANVLGGEGGEDTLTAGAGNDTLFGGSGADLLAGGAGVDQLDGGVGSDVMIGGEDGDLYLVDNAGDTVVETGGSGRDRVISSLSTYTLGDTIEDLDLQLGTSPLDGNGNASGNILTGNDGANRLDGGAGADTLDGGGGDDVYVVDSGGDLILEGTTAPTEIDLVFASTSYTLGAGLEQLALLGTRPINGTGNGLNNPIFGNDAANVLDGGAGNDTLTGGLGNDTLTGGLGNDTFAVNAAADVIVEAGTLASEIDTVLATVSYTLGATHVENLTLNGSAISGTGNALRNLITGNAAANVLDGKAGIDTLVGGLGNDTYLVDSPSDVIAEASTQATEIDTVITTADNRTLGANLEKLTLGGTALVGSGNTLANTLTGNALANTLNGLNGNDVLAGSGGNDTLNGGTGNDSLDGGAGNDSLVGGAGNDRYTVGDGTDVIRETATTATEIDSVTSSATWTLGSNLERLTLAGSSAINGTGNTLANAITGNTGANALSGGAGNDTLDGGSGNDMLTGSTGLDIFRFSSALASSNVDTVKDFVAADDTIQLENAVFTKLTTAGVLSTLFFRANLTGTAADSNDFIVYETDTGKLFYDADGSGTGAPVWLATLTGAPVIGSVDFFVT